MAPADRIRGLKDWERRSTREQQRYLLSLETLQVARNENMSIRRAAPDVGISYAAAMRWLRPATERDVFGRVRAKPADRLFRPMEIPTPEGRVTRAVYGSRRASLLGRYESAIGRFLEPPPAGGDEAVLAPFKGQRVARIPLITDPDVIEDMALRGVFEDLEPYPRT